MGLPVAEAPTATSSTWTSVLKHRVLCRPLHDWAASLLAAAAPLSVWPLHHSPELCRFHCSTLMLSDEAPWLLCPSSIGAKIACLRRLLQLVLTSCALQQSVPLCQLQAVFAAAHGPVQAPPPQQPHGSPHSPERAAHSAVWDWPRCGSCGGVWLRGAAAAGSQGGAISRSAHASGRLGCCRWCLERSQHMLTAQMCTQDCVQM